MKFKLLQKSTYDLGIQETTQLPTLPFQPQGLIIPETQLKDFQKVLY